MRDNSYLKGILLEINSLRQWLCFFKNRMLFFHLLFLAKNGKIPKNPASIKLTIDMLPNAINSIFDCSPLIKPANLFTNDVTILTLGRRVCQLLLRGENFLDM